MKTLNLNEAAAFLHIHPSTLLRLAGSGDIPGAKPGKCWVFLDVDLADWLRTHYKTAKEKAELWDSSSETGSITSRSSVTDEELFALLAPEKKLRRKIRGGEGI